jgi:hypothetical protein
MKSFSFGFLFLALATLVGCESQQSQIPKVFNQNGITFQYPADWSPDDAEKVGSNAASVTCQKKGFDDSGLVTIACFSDSLALSDVQTVYREQLDSTSLYKLAGVKFSSAQPGHLGQHETLQTRFTMSMIGVPHTGWLDAFYYKGHTFMVLSQQADEDSAKSKKGFAMIIKTLDVTPGK